MILANSMHKEGKTLGIILFLITAIVAAIVGIAHYLGSSSIHSLLTNNQRLNEAIKNLTEERQIGYLSVLAQENDELGKITSLVKLTQTAPGNQDRIVSEELFQIAGEVIHLDVLIVKFSDAFVQDGRGRALYLWRRIYGEKTAPEKGETIQRPEEQPDRYRGISKTLRLKDRKVFWNAIWQLAEDPALLNEYGVSAIYGNAVYTKTKPGQIYLIKINASGQIYPDLLSYQ